MPPAPIYYPSPAPILLPAFDGTALAAAVAICRSGFDLTGWQRQLERGIERLPTSVPSILHGNLRFIGSSKQVYTVPCHPAPGVPPCDCKAAQYGRQCWHHALGALVEQYWQIFRPSHRCPHCTGPMHHTLTIGGEASVTCLVCDHELILHPTITLAIWPTFYRPERDEQPLFTRPGARRPREVAA